MTHLVYGTDGLIDETKKNIAQLLHIGIHNSDEQIENHFGGEHQLLSLIKGYLTLVEDLYALKEREQEGITKYGMEED